MGLNNSDYNKIQEVLDKFANQFKKEGKREVTIPLSEYETIKKNENLYFKKALLLEEITQECELVLSMDSKD